MQLRQVGSGPNVNIQPLHTKNIAPTQSPHTGPRRAASGPGFTLVETMVATVLLSMMILGILQVLVGSYRLSAKARYNDHARYIGTNLTWTAQWKITPNVSMLGEYIRELAGQAITQAGGHGANVGVVQVDFNF